MRINFVSKETEFILQFIYQKESHQKISVKFTVNVHERKK